MENRYLAGRNAATVSGALFDDSGHQINMSCVVAGGGVSHQKVAVRLQPACSHLRTTWRAFKFPR